MSRSVTVLNIFSNEIFLTTPNVDNKFWSSCEALESIGEMKLIIKFYLWYVCTISLNFEIYFLEFLWQIAFGVISGNFLQLYLYENAKEQ